MPTDLWGLAIYKQLNFKSTFITWSLKYNIVHGGLAYVVVF